MQLILAGAAVGQTWNDTSGNWGTASNWTPNTVPDTSSATATFNSSGAISDDVSLTGGPFTVGTLNLNNDVSGGFFFEGGTLQLAGPATINVQSHSSSPDFAATATVVLQADATINTSFADSTFTVAGPITQSGGAFSLTKDGPGTLTLTGANTYTGGTIVNAGTFQLGDGIDTATLAGAVTVNNSATLNVMANGNISGRAGGAGSTSVTGNGGPAALAARQSTSAPAAPSPTAAPFPGAPAVPAVAALLATAPTASAAMASNSPVRLGRSSIRPAASSTAAS
jgi:fibronectin-binding autotransporter adhesin